MMNLGLAKKAYMLEFLKNDEVKECFTFAVPPESEDFDFGHRVSETKVFGGTAFDDYGNEAIKITLSGSTVNDELKLIYRGLTKPPDFLTGEEEIFCLQKTIADWHALSTDSGEKTVWLYDLSKMSLLDAARGKPSRNYWRVVIKDLKVKRDKSRPFAYSYTLEMTGIIDDEHKSATPLSKNVTDVLDKVADVVKVVEKVAKYSAAAIDLTKTTVKAAKDVYDECVELKNAAPSHKVSATFMMAFDAGHTRVFSNELNLNVYNNARALNYMRLRLETNVRSDEKELRDNQREALKEDAIREKVETMAEEQKIAEEVKAGAILLSFNTSGGSKILPQALDKGERPKMPAAPTLRCFKFTGWYSDKACTTPYEFGEVLENTEVFAGWERVSAIVSFLRKVKGVWCQATESVEVPLYFKVKPPAIYSGAGDKSEFEGWYSDEGCTQKFDFDQLIITDTKVYGKWEAKGGSRK